MEGTLLKEIANARKKTLLEGAELRVVKKHDELMNARAIDRPTDRSIDRRPRKRTRRAVDTKSSHLSITRTHRHYAMWFASSRYQ